MDQEGKTQHSRAVVPTVQKVFNAVFSFSFILLAASVVYMYCSLNQFQKSERVHWDTQDQQPIKVWLIINIYLLVSSSGNLSIFEYFILYF